MAYSKHAFNCAKCPQQGGDGGCPMWWETVLDNPRGETKVLRSCGYEQLPMYLVEVIKASNRPAAAIESTRNELAAGLMRLADVLPHAVAQRPQLEHYKDDEDVPSP